jgi:hypothetical protein
MSDFVLKTGCDRLRKNLEGNSLKSNSFLVLSIEEIIHTTSKNGCDVRCE